MISLLRLKVASIINRSCLASEGFNLTFMTGFGVSATYGVPDTGLLSSEEMCRSATIICNTLKAIPCIGDGDTVSSV
jgi:2-methylisocitrate lyase-like PEP mutase family enzyme